MSGEAQVPMTTRGVVYTLDGAVDGEKHQSPDVVIQPESI